MLTPMDASGHDGRRSPSWAWAALLAVAFSSAAVAGPSDDRAPATVRTPGAGRTRVVPNTGACKVDGDCELLAYAPGCCDRTCGPRALSKAEVERSRRSRNCPAELLRQCPPSAPCPREPDVPVAAVCQDGTCSTVFKAR